jgi:hypothetical protein
MCGFRGVRGVEIEGGGKGQRHPKIAPPAHRLVAERVLVQSALSERGVYLYTRMAERKRRLYVNSE